MSPEVAERIRRALHAAGQRETGGILMGQHVDKNTFRIVDVTVEPVEGTWSSFWRSLRAVAVPLRRFFKRTGHRYQQFNYLGEWHSHPSFDVTPSPRDDRTMWDIASDTTVGANFVVLLIVRLTGADLETSASIYRGDGSKQPAELVLEQRSQKADA